MDTIILFLALVGTVMFLIRTINMDIYYTTGKPKKSNQDVLLSFVSLLIVAFLWSYFYHLIH
jgi:tryptophan-rich sensory protein